MKKIRGYPELVKISIILLWIFGFLYCTDFFAFTFDYYLDGNKIGDLTNGATIECDITVGEHQLEIKAVEKTVKQGIIVKEDTNSVEVITRLKMGIIAGVPKILDIIYK